MNNNTDYIPDWAIIDTTREGLQCEYLHNID